MQTSKTCQKKASYSECTSSEHLLNASYRLILLKSVNPSPAWEKYILYLTSTTFNYTSDHTQISRGCVFQNFSISVLPYHCISVLQPDQHYLQVPAKKRWWMTPQRLSGEISLMAQILSSGFTLAAFSWCSQVSIPWQIQSLSLPGLSPLHPELQVFFPRADWPSHSRAPDCLPPAVTSSEGIFCSSLTTRKISYLDSVSTSTLENSSVAKALAEGWKQTIFFADCSLTAQKNVQSWT